MQILWASFYLHSNFNEEKFIDKSDSDIMNNHLFSWCK